MKLLTLFVVDVSAFGSVGFNQKSTDVSYMENMASLSYSFKKIFKHLHDT